MLGNYSGDHCQDHVSVIVTKKGEVGEVEQPAFVRTTAEARLSLLLPRLARPLVETAFASR